MTPTVTHQSARDLAAGLARLQPLIDASTSRASGGDRLDRPSRDIAGLGRAAKIDGTQARWSAVKVNLQNVSSQLQVSTDQLRGLNQIVTRLSELATLYQNPVQSVDDRATYALEAEGLQAQLRQIVGGTTAEIGGTADIDRPLGRFNGRNLFGPDGGEEVALGMDHRDTAKLPVIDLRVGAMGDLVHQDGSGNFTLGLGDATALATLDDALAQIGSAQAEVGSLQSRVESAGRVAVMAHTNGEAALSEIRDTDVAEETTRYTRLQILSEGHTAMLAQAREATAKLLPLLNRN